MSFQLPTKCCKWRGRPDVSRYRLFKSRGPTDRQTEFSSLDRVCIPRSAVKIVDIITELSNRRRDCYWMNRLTISLVFNSTDQPKGAEAPNLPPLVDSSCIMKTFSCWTFRRGWISVSLRQILANLSRNINIGRRSSLRGVCDIFMRPYSCLEIPYHRGPSTSSAVAAAGPQHHRCGSKTPAAPRVESWETENATEDRARGTPVAQPWRNDADAADLPFATTPSPASESRLYEYEVSRVDRLLSIGTRRPSSLLAGEQDDLGKSSRSVHGNAGTGNITCDRVLGWPGSPGFTKRKHESLWSHGSTAYLSALMKSMAFPKLSKWWSLWSHDQCTWVGGGQTRSVGCNKNTSVNISHQKSTKTRLD